MQRSDRNKRDDRRAIWNGNDAALLHVFENDRVDLRDDQRNRVVHAEAARVVHHERARLHKLRRPLTADRFTCGEECDVHALCAVAFESFNRDGSALKRKRRPSASCAREESKFGEGKLARLKDRPHFAANNTRSANDCNSG